MNIMKICKNWTIKFLQSYDIHELMKNSKEHKEGAALFNYFFSFLLGCLCCGLR